MPCAFQLLASFADGCGRGATTSTTTTAASVEGAAEVQSPTTAVPRRRRDLQVSINRRGLRLREMFKPRKPI
jgi:hypothetical protein